MTADLIARRKVRARALAKARRAELTIDRTRAAAQLIRGFPAMEGSAVIAGFWPLGTEIDTRPLLERLAPAHRIVLPVTPRDRRQLSFREWTPGCDMEDGPFGTSHPVGQLASGADPLVPTLVMVPLLAFTSDGDRLGYGGGYYDVTLSALKAENPALRAVGVAFADQQVKHVPVEDTDVPLDAILTEEGFRLFRA